MSPSEDLEVPLHSQVPSQPGGRCSGAGWSLQRGRGQGLWGCRTPLGCRSGCPAPCWGCCPPLESAQADSDADVKATQQGLQNLSASLGACSRQSRYVLLARVIMNQTLKWPGLFSGALATNRNPRRAAGMPRPLQSLRQCLLMKISPVISLCQTLPLISFSVYTMRQFQVCCLSLSQLFCFSSLFWHR